MITNTNISSNFNSFIVRTSSKKYMIPAIFLTVLSITAIFYRFQDLFYKGLFEIIVTLAFLFLPVSYLWFRAFDKRIKLLIDRTGIWTCDIGYNNWDNIDYFSLDELKADNGERVNCLYLKLIDRDELIKISIAEYDKTKVQIHDAIVEFSKGYKILDLGYSNGA